MSDDDLMGREGPMDRETMQAIEPRAGDELERTLARYARVRLQPGPAASRRARAVVMEAAWRARIEAAPARRRSGPFAGWSLRRVSTAMAAAVLAGLLVGSTAFAASRAGGPLYGARIAVEDMTLPSDPSARLEAQIAHAQARLAEASEAEARHDEGALAAAVAAYGDSLAELQTTTGPDAGRALQAVQFHLVVLQDLLSNAPDAAVAGLTRAVAASDSAIGHLSAADSDGAAGGAGGGANGGNGNGGPGNGTGGNGNGGPGSGTGGAGSPARPVATAGPIATPAPTKPPKPVHSANPAASVGPDATPATAPSPASSTAPDPKPTRAP